MKPRSPSLRVLAAPASFAFLAQTLAGFGHPATDRCSGTMGLVAKSIIRVFKCEGIEPDGRIVDCQNVNKFMIPLHICQGCHSSFGEGPWQQVQGCFAHAPLRILPQHASRM
ncbi:hypothetical protein PCASD_07401 [Puccinia coronata f. sp. avenae]|nr:hypothetical protein PCASD_21445 [Puccinia coronata f. sp. avenae]PLW46596.1 hypothetical protein PCASD_07401 [Puccinia coronata f. sp. avenae]